MILDGMRLWFVRKRKEWSLCRVDEEFRGFDMEVNVGVLRVVIEELDWR